MNKGRGAAGIGEGAERSGINPVGSGAVVAALLAGRCGAGAGRGAREESPAVRTRAASPPSGAARR